MAALAVRRYAERLYRRSPAENVASARRRLFRRDRREDRNSVVGPLLELPHLPALLRWSLREAARPLTLIGDAGQIAAWGLDGEIRQWDWGDEPPDSAGTVLLCRVPTRSDHHESAARLSAQFGPRLVTIGEVLLGYSRVAALQKTLPYYVQTFEEIAPFYLGETFFGPLDDLDRLWPLAGKRVVEFGPFDGGQTLGLLHLGADVTCIEARADNAVKTQAAADAFGFSIDIRMDDMHNATVAKLGRFDLAFAHGVYYHSIAPFVFLENLVGLADAIFVGGFCATDELPAVPWETLEHDGHAYRVKPYREADEHFTGGVNATGYFFEPAGLRHFFEARGYAVTVITDEPSTVTSGNYSRFLALRA